jgi:glutamine synthetase
LDTAQAIKIVEDVFFNTANHLYNLGLTLRPLQKPQGEVPFIEGVKIANLDILTDFELKNPSIKFIRLQWVDYTTQLRLRVLPIKTAVNMFKDQKGIGITKAVFGLLQHDMIAPGFGPVGQYELIPCFDSLRVGDRDGYAIVQCEFRESDGAQVEICPRTALRRIVERALANGVSFLIGFELEVVFMTAEKVRGDYKFGNNPVTCGHSWSNASALRNPELMEVIEEIITLLERSQIELQQFHPESAPGQIEFITGPLPPLEAVDAVIASRNIIYSVAEKHGLKATFIPKPFQAACGTGAHVHLSMTPEAHYPSFYAGILKHLRAISAFTYSNASSYDRMQDSVWSGGRYVAWGTQNRETPLRKIAGSHWELKCMDGLANPYLALAAVLGAGLKSVLDAEPLALEDCTVDPALMSAKARSGLGIKQMLPRDLQEAMLCLDCDSGLRNILGTALVDAYLLVKRAETAMLTDMAEEERRQFLLERY